MFIKTIRKYREILLYIFFGVCTTAINTMCYYLLYDILYVTNIASTIISWIVAVIFAFVTNKYYVFGSKDNSGLLKEAISFFSCRTATGILDVVIMYISVDVLMLSGILCKIISNIIVIVINYIASKLYIFKSK